MADRESDVRRLIHQRFAAAGLDTSRQTIDRALAEIRVTGKITITAAKYPNAPDPSGPDILTGIGDIGTEGIAQAFDFAGSVAEWLPVVGGSAGDFAAGAAQRAREAQSPEFVSKRAGIQQAEGIGGVIGAYAEHPEQILADVAGSLGPMAAARGVGQGLNIAGRAAGLGARGQQALQVAGGEGAVAGLSSGGQVLEDDGGIAAGVAAGLGTAAATGLIGQAGRTIAGRMGATDVEDVLIGGQTGITRDRVRQAAVSAITETAEEAGQEGSEQAIQNIALGMDPLSGVEEAATVGGLVGGVMGMGSGIAARPLDPQPVEREPVPETPAGEVELDPQPLKPPVVKPREGQPVPVLKPPVVKPREGQPVPVQPLEPEPAPEPAVEQETEQETEPVEEQETEPAVEQETEPAEEPSEGQEPEPAEEPAVEQDPEPSPEQESVVEPTPEGFESEPKDVRRIETNIKYIQYLHKKELEQNPSSDDAEDLRYRIDRGNRMRALNRNRPERLTEAIAAAQNATEEARAVARETVAQEVRRRLVAAGQQEAADLLDSLPHTELDRLWKRFDEGQEAWQRRQRNPQYQEDSLQGYLLVDSRKPKTEPEPEPAPKPKPEPEPAPKTEPEEGITFGKKENVDGRNEYPIFRGGVRVGMIRRSKLGTEQGGGWGWTVNVPGLDLATYSKVRDAKAYASTAPEPAPEPVQQPVEAEPEPAPAPEPVDVVREEPVTPETAPETAAETTPSEPSDLPQETPDVDTAQSSIPDGPLVFTRVRDDKTGRESVNITVDGKTIGSISRSQKRKGLWTANVPGIINQDFGSIPGAEAEVEYLLAEKKKVDTASETAAETAQSPEILRKRREVYNWNELSDSEREVIRRKTHWPTIPDNTRGLEFGPFTSGDSRFTGVRVVKKNDKYITTIAVLTPLPGPVPQYQVYNTEAGDPVFSSIEEATSFVSSMAPKGDATDTTPVPAPGTPSPQVASADIDTDVAPAEAPPDTPVERLTHVREEARGTTSKRSEATFPGSDEKLPAHFAIVDADNLRPSHTLGFGPTPGYRGGQQRTYKPGSNEAAEVETEAARMDARIVDTPSSVNEGLPTLLPWGDAVAGNQRAMMIQRVYAQYPERAEQYRQNVAARAKELGLEIPEGIEHPALVRVLEHDPRFNDKTFVNSLNVASDKTKTKAKDPLTEAIGEAQKINRTVTVVTEKIGGDETLRAFISDPVNVSALSKALVDDGILSNTDLAAYLTKGNQSFTEQGRAFIESMFLVRAIGDPDAARKMRDIEPTVRDKLERSWHTIIQAQNNTGIQFSNLLQSLADIGSKAASIAVAKGKRRATIKDYSTMPVLGETQPFIPESLIQFDNWLRETSSLDIRKAFSKIANQSMTAMFGDPPPSDETMLETIGITAPWEYGETDIAVREEGEQQGGLMFDRWKKKARKLPATRPTPGNAVHPDGVVTTDETSRPVMDASQLNGFDERMAVEMHKALRAAVGIEGPAGVQVQTKRDLKQMKRSGREYKAAAEDKTLRMILNPDWFNEAPPDQRALTMAHELGHIAAFGQHLAAKLKKEKKSRAELMLSNLIRVFGDTSRILRKWKKGDLTPEQNQAWEEAKKISFSWRPFNISGLSPEQRTKYNAYRNEVDEIWADFFGAVLTAPDFVRTNAPVAWNNFHDNMPSTTAEAYRELRDMLAGDEQSLVDHDRAMLDAMRKRQQENYKEQTERDIETRKLAWWSGEWWWTKTLDPFIVWGLGRGHFVRRLGRRRARAGGVDISNFMNHDFRRDTVLRDLFMPVALKLSDNRIHESKFHDLAFMLRIIEGDPVFNEESFKAAEALAELERNLEGKDTPEPTIADHVKFVDRLNPEGMTKKRAQLQVERIREELGSEKFAVAMEAVAHFNGVLSDVIPQLSHSGFITPETAEVLMQAKNYSPYVMLDFATSEKVSGMPKERRGSTRDIDRILAAGQAKTAGALQAIRRNDQINGIVNWLREEDDTDLHPIEVEADWVQDHTDAYGHVGGAWVISRKFLAANPEMVDALKDKAVLAAWTGGKQKFYAVHRMIAAQFSRTQPIEGALAGVRSTLRFTRTLFLLLRPGFHIRNMFRDQGRSRMFDDLVPVVGKPFKFWKEYLETVPTAIQVVRASGELYARAQGRTYANKKVSDKSARRAKEFIEVELAGALPTTYRSDLFHKEEEQDKFNVEDYLMRDDLAIRENEEQQRQALTALRKVVLAPVETFRMTTEFAEKFMDTMEVMPRIAAYRRALAHYGDGNVPLSHIRWIREKIGSPPVDKGWRGQSPVLNTFFQFTTVNANGLITSMEGMRDAGPSATRRRARFGVSATLKMGKILGMVTFIHAVRHGLLGGNDEDDPMFPWVAGLREMASWELFGTIPVPIGLDTVRKRGLYFKIPLDHFALLPASSIASLYNRMAAGDDVPEAAAKALRDGVHELVRSMPGPTATVDWIADTGKLFMGGNPIDDFRERPWFTDDEHLGLTAAEKAMKWGFYVTPKMFNLDWFGIPAAVLEHGLGQGHLLPPQPTNIDSYFGKWVDTPGVGALTKGFLSTGIYGHSEQMGEAREEARIREAAEAKFDEHNMLSIIDEFQRTHPTPNPRAIAERAAKYAEGQVPVLRGKETRDLSMAAVNGIRGAAARMLFISYPETRYLREILSEQSHFAAKAMLRRMLKENLHSRSKLQRELIMAGEAGAVSVSRLAALNEVLPMR